ncbi:winged helix-turn-helix domain-containing protein [Candidatus Viridilinea mediisalina]|uniref:OmpR/PhoB-type domain-containing protein n=1 Tax=Candidatus Viridilinea mediisalina TaxID=2024553 RepID=A0A2A6RNS9_9CHLR|nr:winged helix-turn-helix domain-containing protein [Candidatus Viridilinea mediisalina]PDW04551.1 hypothetical protein CJ255_03290 [Candidatus Viridilinea mediisalina]
MSIDQRNRPLPITFREALLRPVTATLRAGECCSIIGVTGVGKTNLARFLQRRDVQTHYWGDELVWVLLLDSNALNLGKRPDEFAVLELMIHRLICEAEGSGLPREFVAELDRLHSTLLAQPDELLAFRYLERIIGRLCKQYSRQLVIVFDQFEAIWQRLAPRLFLNLRYLRDEFKYHVVYLTMTRERLAAARQRVYDDCVEVESFWEMFDPHVFGLGMYAEADALEMFERIELRHGQQFPAELREAVLRLSGRHPSLLRTLTWSLVREGTNDHDCAALVRRPALAAECAKLWADLLPEEQRLVRQLVQGRLALSEQDGASLYELQLKEILTSANPPELFAPLFASYVQQQASDEASGVTIDLRQRQVLVDGQPLQGSLSPLEFSLLEHLARRAGQVCRRDEILVALYPGEHLEVNDERIDTLLRRLREALGEDGRNPRHLFTHRSVGIRLAQGRVCE